jgi:hypothetical protein
MHKQNDMAYLKNYKLSLQKLLLLLLSICQSGSIEILCDRNVGITATHILISVIILLTQGHSQTAGHELHLKTFIFTL